MLPAAPPVRRPSRLVAMLLALLALLALPTLFGDPPVAAQEGPRAGEPVPALRDGGRILVAIDALAQRLGVSRTDGEGALTLRPAGGVLTLFDGTPDALWQPPGASEPETVPLSAPVQRRADGWFAPGDALDFLGARLDGDAVRLDTGGALPLELPPPPQEGVGFERVDLGNGVPALRFLQDGAAGPGTVSMLLVDLALLPLALPELRGDLDAVLAAEELQRERLLFFVVTADAPSAWEARVTAVQGEREFEARHPFRLRVLRGDPERVAPGEPALGVVLLPESFRLERPLTLRWSGREATLAFRR